MAQQNSFTKLARLYGLVEQQRSAELRLAALAEQEAERARAAQAEAWRTELASGRDALQCGSAAGRVLAESAMEQHAMEAHRLADVRSAREALREAAWQRFRASRMETEQMQRAAERVRAASDVEQERRAQAAADDRFGSRRDWSLRASSRRASSRRT